MKKNCLSFLLFSISFLAVAQQSELIVRRDTVRSNIMNRGTPILQRDFAKFRRGLAIAAQNGSANAMMGLAGFYNQDSAKQLYRDSAVYWYKMAAIHGNTFSMLMLGQLYAKDSTMLNHADSSVVWYKKAANAGNSSAMLSLGAHYVRDSANKASITEAIYWYQQAANANNPYAYSFLGFLYRNGRFHTHQDFALSAYYYYKGMRLGNASCKNGVAYNLYKGLNKKQDYDSAFLLYHQLAMYTKDANAMYFTGIFYENGYGTERNWDSSAYWLKRAEALHYKAATDEMAISSPENPIVPIEPPAEPKNFGPNTVYRRIKHNMPIEAFAGMYKGYAVRYDWGGTHVLSVSPLQVNFMNEGSQVSGIWVEDGDSTHIQGIFTDSNLVFENTRYRKVDHYAQAAGKKELKQFLNARLNLLQQPDSLFVTGNLQLYDLTRRVPARPVYIHLARVATATKGQIAYADISNKLDIAALPNPFSDRLQVQFKLPASMHVKMSLATLQGQTVLQEDAGELLPGTYQHDLNIPVGLSAGTYILIINGDGSGLHAATKSIKVVKIN